jgi:hypothetical protein
VLVELFGGPHDGCRFDVPEGYTHIEMHTVARLSGHRSGSPGYRVARVSRATVDYVKTLRSTADGARVFELEGDSCGGGVQN